MRKLIYAINQTLDGCYDHGILVPDDEVFKYHTNLVREAGLLLFGRKTYELMVPYWPDIAKDPSGDKLEIEFAQAFASKKMAVASRSLKKIEGKDARIVHGNLRNEILKLKKEKGKNILTGGVDIPSQLIGLGLVDECHFIIQPILAGGGRRLLEGMSLPKPLKFKLAETKAFSGGAVALRYLKR